MRPVQELGENPRVRSLAVLTLLAVVALVYADVRHAEFVNFDDTLFIVSNPNLAPGLTLETVRWAFTTTWVGNWKPMIWLSYLLDQEIHGASPGGCHVTNLILHISATLLLLAALTRLTGAFWRSFFVAAVFALHPLHVESVAWVAERKDVLGAVFWMGAMLAWARFLERPGALRYALVCLLFALGLMSKPMLVTLPCVLLLLDLWPLQRLRLDSRTDWTRRVLEKSPLFAMSIVSCVVTLTVQSGAGGMDQIERIPLDARLWNAALSTTVYVIKSFWPQNLAVFYPHPGTSISIPLSGLCGMALAALSIATWRARERAPYLLVGWLWYLGTLVPMIGIVQVGAQGMADRYTYIPLIGLSMMLAWGLPALARRAGADRRTLPAGAALALSALAITSHVQVGTWKNSETLFRHATEVTKDNYLAHALLAEAIGREGVTEEYYRHLMLAAAIRPEFQDLGKKLALRTERLERIEALQARLSDEPGRVSTRIELAHALFEIGRIWDGIEELRRVLVLEPERHAARLRLGIALADRGELAQAIEEFERVLERDPESRRARFLLEEARSQVQRDASSAAR